MELTITEHEGYAVAAVSGVLDESAREPFREHLHPRVAVRGARLILDLAGAPRITSQGINHLVALAADANTKGSQLQLCNAQPFVDGVLSVTKLDKFFDIAPTLEDAVGRDPA